jgi:hypothetical protein
MSASIKRSPFPHFPQPERFADYCSGREFMATRNPALCLEPGTPEYDRAPFEQAIIWLPDVWRWQFANTKAGTLSPSSRLEGLQMVRALEFDCHNHTPRKPEALDHAMCYGAAMIP